MSSLLDRHHIRKSSQFWSVLCYASVLVSLTVGPSGKLAAQPESSEFLDALFASMMPHPNDADAALRYAKISAARGQARVAIALLGRILRADPSLDNSCLALASLYMALGSPALATIYAREALASPQIPSDVAVRAKQLVADAQKRASRSLSQIDLFIGQRHDSDANQATSLDSVFGPQK
jgi:tetratricopeptide (TPR) repeat protein